MNTKTRNISITFSGQTLLNMKEIVAKQRKFFNSNQTKDIDFRIDQLKKFRRLIKENEPLLYKAIYSDFQKSAFNTFTVELALLYAEIDDIVKNIKKWAKWKRVRTNLANLPARSYIIPEPLGVSLIIGAWNYPYQLSLAPAVTSIGAGNTVILKPSELPSESSRAMAQLINNNFDPAFFTVVEGGIQETTELLTQRFDKILFTGSVAVGRIVYQAAAKHLTPVTLELGGKSPVIVTEDCNLETCIKRLVWAKFLNAGQTCIAPDYVLVPPSIKQKFIDLTIKEIKKEQFAVENHNYVQIINARNIKRLAGLLDHEKVCFGGGYNEHTRIFEPTIMDNVDFNDKIMQEEIFGPILPVLTYDSLDKAIEKIKEREKPLSCYVFTNNKKIRNKILTEISFGGGSVNDAVMHTANSHLPFGGVGESGTGSYHGKHGFEEFSHFKSVLDKPTWIEPNFKYFPHTESKLKVIKRMMGVN